VSIFAGVESMNEKSGIKKVAIIGPECTGKSELSAALAAHYNTVWVPEYARGYVDNLIRPYELHDLTTIAHGQLRIEDEFANGAERVLFCDTNLYVIKVWSEFKFATVDPEIIRIIQSRPYDLYLLTYVDIPWEEDPLREHPHKREILYDIYLKEMRNQSVPFVEIKGDRETRKKLAVQSVEQLLTR
jgi:NadR type nicotinamide-nucleotide adenylyltransferase